MSHRYGRHGPHAWLLWRQRHYRSPLLPVPLKKEEAVIHVHIPATAERVIFIMMGNPNAYGERSMNGQVVEVVPDPSASPVSYSETSLLRPSEEQTPERIPSDGPLMNKVKWQAFKDAQEIAAIGENGSYIRLDQSQLDKRMKSLINDYLEIHISQGDPPPSSEEYNRLMTVCDHAYHQQLNERLGIQQERVASFQSPAEARLRAMAIQDRNDASSRSDRDYHIRDLAVIRVLQELNMTLYEATNHISQIHVLADKYQEYYSNPREEVSWPGKGTF